MYFSTVLQCTKFTETSSYSRMFHDTHYQSYISVQCCNVQNLQRNKLIQSNVPQYTLLVLRFNTVLQCTKFRETSSYSRKFHDTHCQSYISVQCCNVKIYKETSSYSRMFHDTHCQSYISVQCCKVQNLQRNKLIQLNVPRYTLPVL